MIAEDPPTPVRVLVLMGVSGSGKTTIATLLGERLHWEVVDGDDFHPPANVAKMHGGMPLTDEDRAPWLASIAAWIDATRGAGRHGVVACSALRKAYRDVLAGPGRPDVRIVYLQGSRALIGARQAARRNHFMPPSLLDSQFATLEEPGPDEAPITVSIEPEPARVVDAIVAALDASGALGASGAPGRLSAPGLAASGQVAAAAPAGMEPGQARSPG